MSASKPRRKMGHPPSGLRPGEKLSDYKRMTIRLPDDVRAKLDAAGWVLGRPQWRVLIDAILAYVGEGETLTQVQRDQLRKAVRVRGTPLGGGQGE